MEAHELQQLYEKVKGTVRTIMLTQKLAKLQEAKQLKEHVDAMLYKEVVLTARLKPWLEEAYVIIGNIEGKLANLQAMQQQLQADNTGAVTEKIVEDAK